MRRAAEPEKLEIVGQIVKAQASFLSLRHEAVVAMLALRASGDLKAMPEKIEAPGEVWLILLAHMIKGPAAGRIIGDEQKFVPRFARHVFGKNALAFSIEIIVPHRDMTELCNNLAGLAESDLGKRQRWRGNWNAKKRLDLRAMNFRHRANGIGQPAFLEIH